MGYISEGFKFQSQSAMKILQLFQTFPWVVEGILNIMAPPLFSLILRQTSSTGT